MFPSFPAPHRTRSQSLPPSLTEADKGHSFHHQAFFRLCSPCLYCTKNWAPFPAHCLTPFVQRRCPEGPLGAPFLETGGPSSAHGEGSVVGDEGRRRRQHVVSFKRLRIWVENLAGSTPATSARPPATSLSSGLLSEL